MGDIRQGAAAALWQDLVREAQAASGDALDESRESYLVFVLLRHQRDERLLARIQALEWLHAQQQVGRVRTDALRDVGDRCLLVAGLFPDLAQRRRVSVDYFVDLGRGAYQAVADAGRDAYAELFAHLAAGYRELVSVLRRIRGPAGAAGLLRPAPAVLH
ncbi:hypothetical protein [Luteimonas wenzhouensis]|jgi:hypothetical protein|uniref:Uncharacterized protein n=1 Tax=Luteimonas wenzhouensis TaxID=2599615 RepID=A0A5C5TZM0_9GAMM|nr:hypothetical protein [Luteimonas wenzhouensis]NLW97173.1 hypothetical protein [Xanthomonadaceae bacterium]TWT19513.1 hypothetical protein FQY79_06565 [Luteimonas wenzhouensis]